MLGAGQLCVHMFPWIRTSIEWPSLLLSLKRVAWEKGAFLLWSFFSVLYSFWLLYKSKFVRKCSFSPTNFQEGVNKLYFMSLIFSGTHKSPRRTVKNTSLSCSCLISSADYRVSKRRLARVQQDWVISHFLDVGSTLLSRHHFSWNKERGRKTKGSYFLKITH